MKSVMIVGVGGQGTLLASHMLGRVMLDAGYDVKVSEVHGMSQRGGSVVTYVRWGERVESPVINEGEADILLAFEQLEAARFLPYLKEGGMVLTNTQQIDPMPVITGAAEYPAGLLDAIREKGVQLTAVDALARADTATMAEKFQKAIRGGWMRPNEVRLREGLPPDDNGGELMASRDLLPLRIAIKNPELLLAAKTNPSEGGGNNP